MRSRPALCWPAPIADRPGPTDTGRIRGPPVSKQACPGRSTPGSPANRNGTPMFDHTFPGVANGTAIGAEGFALVGFEER